MHWQPIVGGIQKAILPWMTLAVFLRLRGVLHTLSHDSRRHTERIFKKASRLFDFTVEALLEGALTGLFVVILAVLLLGSINSGWLLAARHLAPHAMEHGAVECLVLSVVFTTARLFKPAKSALAALPYLQTSLEGMLLLDFCGREFGAEFGFAKAVTAMSSQNAMAGIPFNGTLNHVLLYFLAGFIIYRLTLSAKDMFSTAFSAERYAQLAAILGGFIPLFMYADLLML